MQNRKGVPPPSQVLGIPTAPPPIFHFLFSIFACVLFLAGCAAPGEPTERKPRVPAPVSDLAATQQDDNVILSFTLPRHPVDRLPLNETPAIEIYRDFPPPSAPPPPH